MTPEEVGAGLHAALHAVVDAAIKEGMSLAEAIVAVSDVRETLNDIQENQRADAAAATRAAVPPVDRSQRTPPIFSAKLRTCALCVELNLPWF